MNQEEKNIGFIGTGLMGSRMIQRLAANGYHLLIQNRTRARADALAGPHVEVVDSVIEIARRSKIILSSLTNDDAVKSTYLGSEGVIAHALRGTIVLEMSTVSPETSRMIHAAGYLAPVDVLDVAVSGSTLAVERGELTLLVGGDELTFRSLVPIFEVIARQWFYMGPSGSGTAAKLVVNSLLGVGMQAIAEAVVLGEKLDLQRTALLDMLSHTAVVAPALINKLFRIEQDDFSPQFSLQMMNKDFGLILQNASALGVLMPTTTAAYQVSQQELTRDQDEDFSAVIRSVEDLSIKSSAN
jgi:3-hydroxyisobutyrate dehydrogenase-like beta-hydroxyacid dehydrogenase